MNKGKLVKKTDDLENQIAKLISDKYAEDLETPLMLATAAGNLSAMHLIFNGLRPDEEIMDILARAFKASFSHVMANTDNFPKSHESRH